MEIIILKIFNKYLYTHNNHAITIFQTQYRLYVVYCYIFLQYLESPILFNKKEHVLTLHMPCNNLGENQGCPRTQRFTRVDMNFVQRPSRDRVYFSTHYLLYYNIIIQWGHNRYIIYYQVERCTKRSSDSSHCCDQGPLI